MSLVSPLLHFKILLRATNVLIFPPSVIERNNFAYLVNFFSSSFFLFPLSSLASFAGRLTQISPTRFSSPTLLLYRRANQRSTKRIPRSVSSRISTLDQFHFNTKAFTSFHFLARLSQETRRTFENLKTDSSSGDQIYRAGTRPATDESDYSWGK